MIDPPVMIEECRLAGQLLVGVHAGSPCVRFEQALMAWLAHLSEALGASGGECEDAIAAFDQAAWTTWEAAEKRNDDLAQDGQVSTDK